MKWCTHQLQLCVRETGIHQSAQGKANLDTFYRAQLTILETFVPMKGSLCTSLRSLAVIFHGNAE
jgi:hypothetical protein